jgi:hypothetical protein
MRDLSMNKRFIAPIVLFLLIFSSDLPALVSATVNVCVKKGDWIEYQVSATGVSPEGHDAKWARMEVASVQGNAINLNVTTQYGSGTFLYENVTLNLASGQLGDDFFVPANLAAGDVFFDVHSGNITISGVEQRTYAGTERTVISGSTPQTSFYWDRATGILVEAHSSYPGYNFTMATVADKTNLWEPQTLGLEPAVFYSAIVAAVIAIVAVAAVLVLRCRKKSS